MLILADPESSDFKDQLQYPLTIEGIEVTDTKSQTSANNSQPKIVLDVSLDDYNTYSKFQFNLDIISYGTLWLLMFLLHFHRFIFYLWRRSKQWSTVSGR